MKKVKITSMALCVAMVMGSCGTAQKNGTLIGSGSGAVVGALAGYLLGGQSGKWAAIGAGIGTAVGGTAGNLIGRHMDKVKAEAAAKLQNAEVSTVTDANGLTAVKVTFDSGIQFASGKSVLNAAAGSDLTNFAAVLKGNTDCSVAIQGYTDNDAWKNSTAEQSVQKNLTLSQQRADAVKDKLLSCGVAASQITSSVGYGEENPVADNATKEGKQKNRRVEVYLYASEAMINAANAGTLN